MLFGCRDLWRVNSLELRRIFGRLTEQQGTELANAHPNDRRVASWFRWLTVAGFAAAAGYFAGFLPDSWTLLGWIYESLSATSLTSGRFWQSIVFAALAITPLALLAGVTARDHLRRRRTR